MHQVIIMNVKLFCIALSFLGFLSTGAQEIPLKKGMVIKKSVKIRKGIYQFDGYDSLDRGVIRIEGNNITVDFNKSTLKGSHLIKSPDGFSGLAIIIENSNNVTIKNLSAKGYKVAVIARNANGLTIENCDFSYNYREHLNSSQEKEDISDWMSYHHNERDEWLRYGAAIYLRGCNNSIISYCHVTGGQNALMMTECANGLVYNNDFSYNSGVGIGLYKSLNNKILYNKINFNVRGYSDGVYNRGQDSAGILVYEQSNNNLFYKNAVTHSGDGFFLWAGQTTMDTGKGGCNDNTIIDNDFSYAPTNGIEVTFSRNKIIHNRIFECDHGIWGGYSFSSDISENQFRFNRIAIAIEHGQNNDIHHNLFYKDKEAINLWADKEESSDWGYPRYRDTRSRNYNLVANSFNNDPVVFDIRNTDSLHVFENRIAGSDIIFKTGPAVTNMDTTISEEIMAGLSEEQKIDLPEIKDPIDPFKGLGKLGGRKNILITEWGPYDFQYPIIRNTNPADTSAIVNFNVLGPQGKWKIVESRGLDSVVASADTLPARLTAKKAVTGKTDIAITAEYTGSSFIDPFGERVPGHQPYRFSFSKFFQPIDFLVKWYEFDSSNNPVHFNSLKETEGQKPFKTEQTDHLDYAWWGGIQADGQSHRQFLMVAEGQVDLPEGLYEVGVTWDRAVRVYIDSKLIIDEWNPSVHQYDESPHQKKQLKLAGRHNLRIEHVGAGSFATLSFKIKRLN